MQTLIGFLRDLGWPVTIEFGVLLLGVAIHYLQHWGETRRLNASRMSMRLAAPLILATALCVEDKGPLWRGAN